MTWQAWTRKDSGVSLPKVIAIDGPVASGKTAVGRQLAQRLGYRFIDTGLMYRACTYLALRQGVSVEDPSGLTALAAATVMDIVVTPQGERLQANSEDVTDYLRTPEVQASVSDVSKVAGVRVAMVDQQQRMAEAGEVVMVGRDIGTKVLPDAGKVYLEASVDERVRRRVAEVDGAETEAEVRANLELRDRIDSERVESPLSVADDAVVVETDALDVEGVVGAVIAALGGGA